MREVIADIEKWLAAGQGPVGLATVVATWGSAPRREGAKLAFTAGGAIAGSVSGGCVEGAVVEAGGETLAGDRPQLLTFGVADETAWEVGLACGGTIRVYVERLDEALFARLRDELAAGRRAAVATRLVGPDAAIGQKAVMDAGGVVVSGSAPPEVVVAARDSARSCLVEAGGAEWFVDVIRPLPALVVVGGSHIAVALVELARIVGFTTVVVDPRRAFASAARFAAVDRLMQVWPAEALGEIGLTGETVVVTLSHDPKIDDPALVAALDSPAFYIGALGSRKTHAARRARLAALGFTAEQLDRVRAPVGLNIAAETPEEIALAVMAEVVAAYRSR